jgi:GDPmannose 4,6-dehydratase
MNKIGLIIGANGMDGSLMSEFLLNKNYIVYGIVKKNHNRIDHLFKNPNFNIFYSDVTDFLKLIKNIKSIIEKHSEYEIFEIYNFATHSDIKVSFEEPIQTSIVNSIGTLNILEAIRFFNLEKKVKFFQASTSEMYGKVQEKPQNENTPFYPRSPYAISKLYAYWMVKNYRETYNIFACNGILFNHTSPKSSEKFVYKKITTEVGKILRKEKDCLYLGNLNAKRDLSYANDFIEGIWMMLQHNKPDDFVLSTGETHSVREFVERAFRYINIHIIWEGYGINEVGKCAETGKIYVKVNEKYFRPTDIDILLGDSTKARNILGWKPKHNFENIIKNMLIHDI